MNQVINLEGPSHVSERTEAFDIGPQLQEQFDRRRIRISTLSLPFLTEIWTLSR